MVKNNCVGRVTNMDGDVTQNCFDIGFNLNAEYLEDHPT